MLVRVFKTCLSTQPRSFLDCNPSDVQPDHISVMIFMSTACQRFADLEHLNSEQDSLDPSPQGSKVVYMHSAFVHAFELSIHRKQNKSDKSHTFHRSVSMGTCYLFKHQTSAIIHVHLYTRSRIEASRPENNGKFRYDLPDRLERYHISSISCTTYYLPNIQLPPINVQYQGLDYLPRWSVVRFKNARPPSDPSCVLPRTSSLSSSRTSFPSSSNWSLTPSLDRGCSLQRIIPNPSKPPVLHFATKSDGCLLRWRCVSVCCRLSTV
ncbi:hypothetical protein F5Y11DRAFT_109107 [Daldinia sp. FL1419]|nr:hypothetical protein F5Y11DRAFT_109107 [Daldinia sp. FL1419]